jgi:hypothetical protein
MKNKRLIYRGAIYLVGYDVHTTIDLDLKASTRVIVVTLFERWQRQLKFFGHIS